MIHLVINRLLILAFGIMNPRENIEKERLKSLSIKTARVVLRTG